MPREKLYEDEKVVALSVRLPETMYAQIQRRSMTNRRSMNQEIVWLVQYALEHLEQERKRSEK